MELAARGVGAAARPCAVGVLTESTASACAVASKAAISSPRSSRQKQSWQNKSFVCPWLACLLASFYMYVTNRASTIRNGAHASQFGVLVGVRDARFESLLASHEGATGASMGAE